MHVAAARMLMSTTGVRLGRGDAVSYVVCAATQAVPVRAFSTESEKFSIDLEYYACKQIIPTCARLLKIIDPHCTVRLADAMGTMAIACRGGGGSRKVAPSKSQTPIPRVACRECKVPFKVRFFKNDSKTG
jgi:hypothetical protein